MRLSVSEAAVTAALCRASFFDFVREFWSVNVAEKPVWNWHIKLICDEFQKAAERVFRGEPKTHDYIFNVPPGSSKSTVLSVCACPWAWTRMPSARFINGSYTYPLALDLSRKSRDIIESDKYKQCFPEIVLRADQNTKGHFANTSNGMRYAVGVGGSVIGMHAHFLTVDDPLDPTAAISEDVLAEVNRWCSETLPSRKVDKLVSVMMLVMQRLHQNDPTGNRVAKGRETIRQFCLPAELTKDTTPEYAHLYKDKLLDPVRMPRAVLEAVRKELGEYGYACQYLQSPIPEGGAMFKADLLKVGTPPTAFERIYRFWDKAGTAAGGAFTVGVKMGRATHPIMKTPTFWVLNVKRGQWDSGERERIIVQTAREDGRGVVVGLEQEPGSGGKESASGTVRRLAGYRVVVTRPTGDKTVRADEFSTQVNDGNVSLAPGGWNNEYIEELKYFPYGTYKDQVDASSGAFSLCAVAKRRVGAF